MIETSALLPSKAALACHKPARTHSLLLGALEISMKEEMNEHLVLIFIYLGANQQDEASAQECDLVQQQCGGKEFQEKSSVWFDRQSVFLKVCCCVLEIVLQFLLLPPVIQVSIIQPITRMQ